MTYFYQADTVRQSILLVINQLTLISLAASLVLLFARKCRIPKILAVGFVFLLTAVQFVLMQLDSRMTGLGLQLPLPIAASLLISLLSAGYGVWAILSETKHRKTISHSSIQEAFDNLPTGVCFFNEMGLPVLCNPAMQRFSFAVCSKDVQVITDLEECLNSSFVPSAGVKKDGSTFVLPDARAWYLEKRTFLYEHGCEYTQFIAADVTDLHRNRVALQEETEHLRIVQANLQRLSANIVAITREEEILGTKMRVHDEMGRCLVAAQKYLKEDAAESIPSSVAAAWQRAVSMIKYSNETNEEDMLLQIRKTCEYVKIAFRQTGELPRQESVAYLLTCAVRECVTNAVRYAEATELYADFFETESAGTVTVTNNGKIPEQEIVEGGGLSTLRRRVERAGGSMTVQSLPYFRLTVTVPKGKVRIS